VIGSRPILSEQLPPAGISAEDWAATPQMVCALVMEFMPRVAQVEARPNQTSRHSSKPPSSDPPQAKPCAAKDPRDERLAGSRGMEARDGSQRTPREAGGLLGWAVSKTARCA
jgi:hypothetical protein